MQFPRHSPSTCISIMYVNMRSMHEYTKSCVNVLLPNEHNYAGTHINAMYVCAVCSMMHGHTCMNCVCVR